MIHHRLFTAFFAFFVIGSLVATRTQVQSINLTGIGQVPIYQDDESFFYSRIVDLSGRRLGTASDSTRQSRINDILDEIATQYPYLTQLILSKCDLGPDDSLYNLEKLPDLIYLNIENNHLTYLPDALCSLRELEYLDCFNNQINELPATFCTLEQLKILNLSGNPCSTHPCATTLSTPHDGLFLNRSAVSNFFKAITEEKKAFIKNTAQYSGPEKRALMYQTPRPLLSLSTLKGCYIWNPKKYRFYRCFEWISSLIAEIKCPRGCKRCHLHKD